MKKSKQLAVGALVLASVVTLAACGSSDGSSHMGSSHMGSNSGSGMMGSGAENAPVTEGAREIAIDASSFAFEPKTLHLAAGEPVTIVLTSSDVEHDVTVQKHGHIVHADAGETERGGLTIEQPGTYTFWCSVSGHREAGMTGTIVVS